jgi:HEAT repeat protein
LDGYLSNSKTTPPTRLQADEAVKAIGTNAIPTLLNILQTKGSLIGLKLALLAQKQHLIHVNYIAPESRYGEVGPAFQALGSDGKHAVPALIGIYERNVSGWSRYWTAGVLGTIGPAASNAVPMLLMGATDTNGPIRSACLHALGSIHTQPELVVPALMQSLKDKDPTARIAAAGSLGDYGKDARASVPALKRLLNDPDMRVRFITMKSLQLIGPADDGKGPIPEK